MTKLTIYHQATNPGDVDYSTGKVTNEVFKCNESVLSAASIDSITAQNIVNWAKNNYVDSITTEAYAGSKIEQILSLEEIVFE